MPRGWLVTLSVLAWIVALAAGAADVGLGSAITAADLDLPNCSELPPNPRTETYCVNDKSLAAFLRLQEPLPPHTLWRTGEGVEPDQHVRLAFGRPVAIGTILGVTTGRFSVLRPEAKYPGDLANEADWTPLADPHPTGEVRVIPLPAGLAIRAVRVSFHRDAPPAAPCRSEIAGLRLLRGRFVNLAWDAVPLASSELARHESEKEAHGRQGLNDGRAGDLQGGQWRNLPGKPLSETDPAWVALLWQTPQRLAAVGFVNAFAKELAIDLYTGPADVHPLTAPAAAWTERGRATVPVPWRPAYCDFFVPLADAAETRSLRVRFIQALTNENPDVAYHSQGQPTHARLGELLALSDLGDQPLSAATAAAVAPVEYEARMSENRGQQAVPAPGPVAIDGELGDWDKSGGIFMCQDTSLLVKRASAWGYVMFNAEALYVALDISDPTPLRNQHDPDSEPGLGWGGDCIQLRLKTDRVTHLTTWYSATKQRPVMHVAYGANFDEGEVRNAVGQPGVELAFRARPDGSGYVEEMRLPWSLITKDGSPRRAGETMVLHYDLKWGTRDAPEVSFADNLAPTATTREGTWRSPALWGELSLAPKGGPTLPLPPWLTPRKPVGGEDPIAIHYELPALPPSAGPGEAAWDVTVVIDDAHGKRVRNLVSGVARAPGPAVERWDGTDDRGQLQPPGDFRWKAIYRLPLHLAYQFSVNHAGTPPWLSGTTGGWLSDHCPPQSACAVGEKVFIGAAVAEAGHTLLAVDLDGHKLWGTKWLNLAGAQALASDGQQVYVGSEGGWIGAKLQINLVEPNTYRFHNRVEETFEKQENLPGLVGLAVRAGRAYLALQKPGAIVVYELPADEKAKGTRVAELPLPEPGGLAFDAAGDLWAVSGKQVVRFREATGSPAVVITRDLEAPRQLAFAANGDLYVSDGPPAHQVKVFSPDGKLRRAIGRPGGRRVGTYEPRCMDSPQGLAVDARGQLWVCENSRQPKRVSVWSPKGRLVRAFHGPTRYGGSGYLDATDVRRLHDDGMTFELDWRRGTWDLTQVHYRFGGGPGMIFERTPGRSWSYRGREFLANYDYWTSRYLVLYERRRDGAIVPLASAGRADYLAGHTISGVAAWVGAEFADRRGDRDLKDLNYLWSDLNRDGRQQPDEVSFFQTPAGGVAHWAWEALWSMWITEDGGFVVSASGNGPRQYAWKLPVVRWQANGAPVYDPGHPRLIADVARRQVPVYGNCVQSVLADAEGRAILIANPISGCDADGRELWTYENPWPGVHGSHAAPSYKPGMVLGGMLAIGTARLDGDLGELFAITGNKGQIYLFSTDGLLIATLFQDCRSGQPWNLPAAKRGMRLDELTLGEEHFGGHFTRSSDGRFYLVVGFNHTSLVEVEGLASLQRLNGTCTVDADSATKCEKLARERAFAAAQKETPKHYRVMPAPVAPATDGDLADWAKVGFCSWEGSSGQARMALSYDAANLYAAWDVADATPLLNRGSDWRLLFKTGDAVDLQLGTDPKADPKRREPVPGDLRLLVTAQEQAGDLTPVVVLYRHRVPGVPVAEKVTFSSPWRSAVVDQVVRLAEARVAVRVDAAQKGYVVELAVPLSVLGLKLTPGLRLSADAGVLCGDAAGETTIERAYWSNHSVNFTSDVPGEIMLYPNFWGTVEFAP